MALITVDSVRAYAAAAGFSGQALTIATAIAIAESGVPQPDGTHLCDTAATNTAGNTPPSTDRGLWQVNSYWHAEVSDAQAFDPAQCAIAAYRISSGGTKFSPWATFSSGAYQQYLTEAGGTMTMRQVRDIRVQGEFQGYNGDCTQDAADSALHSAYPSRYPVTPAELNALAKLTIDAGQADPNGAMNPAQLAWLLQHEGVPFHQLVTPDWNDYSHFTAWQDAVRQWGGIKPMIVQIAHGEWLPGSWSNPSGSAVDHAVALAGYDPASGDVLLADGNSSYGGNGQVTRCPWATLARALPYALTIVDVECQDTSGGGNVAVQPVWNDANGGTLSYPAHDGLPAIMLEHGQAYYAKDSRIGCYPLRPGTYDGATGDSLVYWSDGQRSRAVKSVGWAVHLEDAGPVLAAMWNERDNFSGQVQALTTANHALSDRAAALQTALNAANANVATLTQRVADLQAQLAKQPPVGQPVDLSAVKAAVADMRAKLNTLDSRAALLGTAGASPLEVFAALATIPGQVDALDGALTAAEQALAVAVASSAQAPAQPQAA